MYNLTDYSLSDLRIIQVQIEDGIQNLEGQISQTKQYLRGELRESLLLKYGRKIAVLREHNVHLLTAVSIVKERETVNSN